MMRLAASASCALVLVLGVAACGGSSPATYSRSAYVACLHSHNVRTQSLSEALAGRDKKVAEILNSIAPSAIVAHVPRQEIAVVAFARDDPRAHRIAAAFMRLAHPPGATVGKVVQEGSIVVVSEPHIAAGTEKTLDTCRARSAVR